MAEIIKVKAAGKGGLRYKPLYPADLLKFEVPQTAPSLRTVEDGRIQIANIIHQRDDRLLVIVGPRFVRHPRSALRYAQLLHQASLRFKEDLCIVMRCYIDRPQSVDGWSGFLNDPLLDGSYEINQGLQLTRKLFVDITDIGLPVATELLESLSQLYFTDLVSISLAAARLAESSLHRELASSLQFPVGFTAMSAGDVGVAVDAITVASTEHHYISATPAGRAAIAWTPGNENCFVIAHHDLPDAVSNTVHHLLNAQKSPVVVVDCSQDNQSLDRQLEMVHQLRTLIEAGGRDIVGAILDSSLQDFEHDLPKSTPYGMDLDGCTDWEATSSALEDLARATRKRREIRAIS